MEIEILHHPTDEDWLMCKKAALMTVSKNTEKVPTFEWKVKMLKAMHSPIRVLPFFIVLKDIPYYVSVHLVRHVHATPFVSSQRNDRQDNYDRTKAPQDAPVTMGWYMNAEELINIAHKRLCRKASKETRQVVEEICKAVIELNPEFKDVLIPNCFYRGGVCEEFESCGYNAKYALSALEELRSSMDMLSDVDGMDDLIKLVDQLGSIVEGGADMLEGVE